MSFCKIHNLLQCRIFANLLRLQYDDAMIRYLADEEDDLFLTNLREKIKTLNSKQNLGILLIFQKVSPTSEFTLIF